MEPLRCFSHVVTTTVFHVGVDQHVPRILRGWFDGRSEKPTEKCFSAIGQHLLDNPECAKNYKKENFSVLVRAENSFQLHILEALCIQSLRPSLCKQKKFVYQ